MSSNLSGMAMPPGVDPRMFAFLQAQRQLQQGQPSQHTPPQHLPPQQQPQGNNGQLIPPPQPQQQQQQHHQQQPPVPSPLPNPLPPQPPQQRPGGDADVASFLLQLKMKPNGEPVTEAEALRMVQQQHQQQQQQQQIPQMVPSGQTAGVTGYPHNAVPIPGMYGYPGLVPFPRTNGNFAAVAAAAMGVRQPLQPQPPPPGYPSVAMHSQPVVQPPPQAYGMNQAPLASAATAAQGLSTSSAPPSEATPVLTDAYIESLITNDASSGDNNDSSGDNDVKHEGASETSTDRIKSAKDDMNISLVVPEDRDLIPDALFVALGQMKPCRLQQTDRVGCYKTRTLGFLGMCCKHCGGQPGFGRYFPNSVRSLAQTTTSQTILKHVGGKCRFCPQNVRKAVLELQRQQAHKEHLTTGRPRYGSRKIFFQRMWSRLHGPSEDGESARVVVADVSPGQAKEEAERATLLAASEGQPIMVTPKVALESGILPITKEATSTLPRPISTLKRSLPPEVSNNNTDDEGSSTAPLQPGGSGVLDINLSLSKRRKLSEGDRESSARDDENKKLRISTVAV